MNLLTTNQVCQLLKTSRATLYRSIRHQRHFPKAVRIGERKLAWDEIELHWWITHHAPKA